MRLFPEPTIQLAVEDVYGGISLPPRDHPPAPRPYVIINMVSSLDGKAAVNGKAGSIGDPVDRALMRALRARADAVMIGAGTLRAEKLTLAVPEDIARTRVSRGIEPQPLAVVATGSGDIPLQKNLLGPPPENRLVLASPGLPGERLSTLSLHASVEVLTEAASGSGPGLCLTGALETLKERYAVDVLLVEGGPTLNQALIHEGLADELFLTMAPKLLGGLWPGALTILEGLPVPPGKTRPRLISVHLSGDELFLRYALHPPDR